jgi:pimeloyl-ACP methyl ester carboxylesterase
MKPDHPEFRTGAPSAAPQRPTVVLLHASGSSSRQWDALAGLLQATFDVHAIDLHGHGRQPPWRGRRTMLLDDEVAPALPLMRRAGGAHLVGHSYGGAVALHLAATQPALVRSVAVYEPALFGLLAEREPRGAASWEVRSVAAGLRVRLQAGQAHAAAEAFIDYWSGEGSFARLGTRQRAPIVQRMPCVLQHFDALDAQPTPAARLAALAMPLLCLTGSDTTAASRRIDKLLRALLPQARHELLPDLGHMGPVTHAGSVNARWLHFLRGQVSGAVALPATPQPAELEALA